MILAEIERLIPRTGDDVVLVACSGGVDSVVLAHAAAELLGARRVILGHVEHGVRPSSGDDADFVRRFAGVIGAAVEVRRVEPESDAEAELRRVRYAALEEMRKRHGAAHILTAHTRDDVAETVLLQLIRTGVVTGIPRERGSILRPLLDVPRAEVRSYAERRSLKWREDPTNLEPPLPEEPDPQGAASAAPLPLQRPGRRPSRAEYICSAGGYRRRGESGARDHRRRPGALLHGRWPGTRATPSRMNPIGSPSTRIESRLLRFACFAPGIGSSRSAWKVEPRSRRCFVRRGCRPAHRWGRPLVVDAADQVIWVPGVLRSAVAPVGNTTKRAWILEMRRDGVLQVDESRVTVDAPENFPGETPGRENDS